MALTAAEITEFYRISGIPEHTTQISAEDLGAPYWPALTFSRDISSLKTAIDTRLAALSVSQLAQVSALLTRWLLIPTKPQVIRDTGGSVLDDYAAERAEIRRQLQDLTGIIFPAAGSTRIVR